MTTLDNLRKAARRWHRALRAGDAEACARLARAWPSAPAEPTLRDVQHALARERGHESWVALTRAAARGSAPEAPLAALLDAAGKGDVAAVAAILDAHPALVNERGTLPGNTGLRTALHFGSGHEPIVRTLLERGADPNIRDEGDNAYPLHFAAERGDLAVVRLLVEHGADPIGAGTTHELDVLGWAVCFEYAQHLEVARYLLAHGARHTLLSAVAMGEADEVRAQAASGADLNQRMDRTNQRRTPLHLAVVKKQAASLEALVELGADLDAEDTAGMTPLDQAALLSEDGMVRRLVEAGAAIRLPAAIALGRTDIVERLVREDPEALSLTSRERWARILVHASSRAPGRVIDTLLRTLTRYRGGLSVVNVAEDETTAVDGAGGYTALHAAAFHGNDEAVDVLLAHGANPRARDRKYCGTPAGWAAYAGHRGTANRILDADIDIFEAIDFDRADRVVQILDRDSEAMDRPFKAYASCEPREGQWWPHPECTPLEWATSQGKEHASRVLIERGAGAQVPADGDRAGRVAAFLQSACWDHEVHGKASHRMHDRAAQRILSQDPTIARASLYTAIVCGERDEVARILAGDAGAARARGGPRNWTPILYLAYTRFTHMPTIEHALAIARLLLDHGADPNDFYMAGDARYSVLTGVAGEGEQDAPRQPYAAALFDLLLERGAEPFDVQVLYNTHFSGDMLWWLQLVHARTIGTPRGAAWQDPDWRMFDAGAYGSGARFVLETAVTKRNVPLAGWALAHGANPNAAPARDRRFPQRTLYELAMKEGAPGMADLLARHGATPSVPVLDERERFLDACFRLDREDARRLLAVHPEYRQSPEAMFESAKRDRPDVLALLIDLGFPIDIQDRTGKRALHEAAIHDGLAAAEFLVERGAEVDARESTYDSPPIGWAAHADHVRMLDFLSRHSRDIWRLCFRGYVDRVRELLAEDPRRAHGVDRQGHTPLWWLPDDEAKAMQIVALLLAAGADPGARSQDGRTAADWARRRGMHDVAARLDDAGRLFEAARSGDLAALTAHLDEDPRRLHARSGPYAFSLLHTAAQHGQLAVVEELLRRGLDVNTREKGDNTTAMHWAAAAGRLDIVQRLADAGGDVVCDGDDHELGVIGWATCWDECDDEAHRAVAEFLVSRGARHHIFSAIAVNSADDVRRIVSEDPSALNRRQSRNENHRTPLHFAVHWGRPEMVSLLLELGADPLAVDSAGQPVAMYAKSPDADRPVMEEIREMVRAEFLSADRGGRPARGGAMDLVAVLALGDRGMAERLARESPAALEASGGALHLMVHRNDADAVTWLLDRGADVNGRYRFGGPEVTPLHVAARSGHVEMIRLLLDAGADPTIRDTGHHSDAVGWAEHFGQPAVVRLLRAHARRRPVSPS